MSPQYRPPLFSKRTRHDLEQDAECSQWHLLQARQTRYTFPVQEVLALIHRLYGVHAALLATDALEREWQRGAKNQTQSTFTDLS